MADVDEDVIYEVDDIHTWFNLTYANYLVLPRSLMQSMPEDWQRRMVACLTEIDGAFHHVDQASRYLVQARDAISGKFVKDPVPHYNRGRTHVDRWDELTAEQQEAYHEERRRQWSLDA